MGAFSEPRLQLAEAAIARVLNDEAHPVKGNLLQQVPF